ncbi:MAG: adenosylcobinamide-phosphate synthase CbiB [Halanaeroarchaeum sp.]
MTVALAAAIALAFALDLAVGEPPSEIHPVVALGRVIDVLDRSWPRPALAGLLVAIVVPAATAVITGGVVGFLLAAEQAAGIAAAGVFLFSSVSLRRLQSAARRTIRQTTRDVDAARESVRALVGRETGELSAAHVRSAALESAAENLADGLIGPLVAFLLGGLLSLPVAVGAATWVKAVDTLDSMLGYRSHPMGWASARLDDVAAWIPARISALLIALAAASPGSLTAARDWAAETASPNAGWPMATIAVVTGSRLEKPSAYRLGPSAELPDVERALVGVRTVYRAGIIGFALAVILAWS